MEARDAAEQTDDVDHTDGGRQARARAASAEQVAEDAAARMQLVLDDALEPLAYRDPGGYFARARREAQEHARRTLRERLVSPVR